MLNTFLKFLSYVFFNKVLRYNNNNKKTQTKKKPHFIDHFTISHLGNYRGLLCSLGEGESLFLLVSMTNIHFFLHGRNKFFTYSKRFHIRFYLMILNTDIVGLSSMVNEKNSMIMVNSF